jgi:hypothetical protein
MQIEAIEPLDRIICRRPKCEKFKGLIKDNFKPNNLTIKVNHYHYGVPIPEVLTQANVAELPAGSSLMGRIELPCEPMNREYSGRVRSGRLSTIREEVRPRVNATTKPTIATV